MRQNQYSHKPRPCFQGDDAYYLGVELEVEAPDDEAKHKGLSLRQRPRGLYAKCDGSLNSFGWELVTHPIARNLWLAPLSKAGAAKRFFDLVGELRGLKYNSHDGGRCGLHVHISRTAFGSTDCELERQGLPPAREGCLRNEHFYWFARLINSPLFMRISQRTTSAVKEWAEQLPIQRAYFHLARHGHAAPTWQRERRTAINLTNHTVEIRIFRGNMREDRIRKALEAVIAAVEWSRTQKHTAFHSPFTIELKEVDVDQEFINYVVLHRHVYKRLHAYLAEIGMLQARPGTVVKPEPEDGAQAEPAAAPISDSQREPQGVLDMSHLSEPLPTTMPVSSSFMESLPRLQMDRATAQARNIRDLRLSGSTNPYVRDASARWVPVNLGSAIPPPNALLVELPTPQATPTPEQNETITQLLNSL